MRGLSAVVLVLVSATGARAADLVVTVTGVRNATGQVELCLFRGPDGFPDCTANTSIQRAHVPATPGSVSAAFPGLAPGSYAVSVFHDEKGLHRIETNFLGIPRSGLGASRDAPARFGPPSFRDAAFSLPEGRSAITIRLRYP